MTKITLTDLVNLENQTTAVSAINTNNAILETALDNTLSRDGTSPNTMSSLLDMNSHQIVNLPAPGGLNSPLRLTDLNEFIGGGSIAVTNIPLGGSTHQVLTKASGADYDTTWVSPREILLADRTYYVRSDGSNSNNGLANTSGGAFLTPQKAVDVVLNTLDRSSFNITIKLTGAFTTGIVAASPGVGTGSITITSTDGASITTTNTNAVAVSNNCHVSVSGALTLSTVTDGIGLLAYDNGSVSAGGIIFSACAGGQVQAGWVATPNYAFTAGPGTVYLNASYSITGGGVFHWHVTTDGSSIVTNGNGITGAITGNPAYSGFFIGITKGLVYVPGVVFTGTATGPKYLVHNAGALCGLLDSNIPGSTAGQLSAGAILNPLVVGDTDSIVGVNLINGVVRSAAPTPGAGLVTGWFDSTSFRFRDIDPLGRIGTTVRAKAAVTNEFLASVGTDGVFTSAQPTLANIGGFGTNVGTFLTTPTSANLAAAVTDETGSGSLVFATSPTLVTPSLGTPSGVILTNATGLPSGSIVGTVAGGNAASGVVGEFLSGAVLSGSAVSLTTGNAFTIVTLSLTAGDWNVWGSAGTNTGGAAIVTALDVSVNTTTAVQAAISATNPGLNRWAGSVTGINLFVPATMQRISLSSTTNVFLVVTGIFTTGTLAAYGFVGARRVR